MTAATLDFDNFTLTEDQQKALDKFFTFLMDPVEMVFVLEGYSGCGKSTLVRTLLDRLPDFQKTIRLINPNYTDYQVELTATTNKAAENLAQITGMEAGTIQSFLGLRVEYNARTNESKLIPKNNFTIPEGALLFIDEASQIDKTLLGHVFSRTARSKVVFIGDPAQLLAVKSIGTPVFNAGFNGAALTTVVRQAEGNPIVDLSTQFRHTVNTGAWPQFTPDGHHVQRLDRAAFNAAIKAEFTRPGWKYADSKILAYTNKCVVAFNEYVRNMAKGDPHFQEMDYAACNSFLSVGKNSIKTDQLVQITKIEPDSVHEGVSGNWVVIDYSIRTFHPKSLAERNARAKQARAAEDYRLATEIETAWIDLRGVFAQTINKAQGSTFGSVFIDLDNVGECHNGEQIARMLYVGVSRARNHVYLCGDLA